MEDWAWYLVLYKALLIWASGPWNPLVGEAVWWADDLQSYLEPSSLTCVISAPLCHQPIVLKEFLSFADVFGLVAVSPRTWKVPENSSEILLGKNALPVEMVLEAIDCFF